MKLSEIFTPEANNTFKHIAKDVLIVVLGLIAGCEHMEKRRIASERAASKALYMQLIESKDPLTVLPLVPEPRDIPQLPDENF